MTPVQRHRRTHAHDSRGRWFLAALVVVLVVVGTGLWRHQRARAPVTDPPMTGELHVPSVYWPEGRGTGRWDKDPWVITLRHAQVLRAAANNQGDYSSELMADAFSVEFLRRDARDTAESADPAYYMPGPSPFAVLDVRSDADTAHVRVCSAWSWDTTEAEYVSQLDEFRSGSGSDVTWELERRPDGTRRVVDVTFTGDVHDRCPIAGAVVGYFDPAPPYGEPLDAVLGPDGRVVEPRSVQERLLDGFARLLEEEP